MNKFLYAVLCIGILGYTPIVATAQILANFSANNTGGCAPVVVQFTDQSTGTPTSWNWTLGNGTISTLQNPSTTYTTTGTYTVTLTVSNGTTSNTKTITNYITVAAQPFANFVADDSGVVCIPSTINFQNLCVSNATGASTYLWDFGDGTTSAAANPSHTYTTPGIYNIALVITNANGCTRSIMKNAYVSAVLPPIPDFTSLSNLACNAPTSVSFSNITAPVAATYSWSFGDGGTSSSTNPTHTYNTTGTYNVRLIAIAAIGCSDTITKPAFVMIGHPQAAFSPSTNSVCAGSVVSFSNNSLPANAAYQWTFGDGTTSAVANPAHAYGTAGTYSVKLTVTSGGCTDTISHSITVLAKPAAGFGVSATWSCTSPFTVQFHDSSTNVSSWLWNFGDGTTSTSANPSHTYNTANTFNVKLVVTNSNGCTDSLTKTALVAIGQPTATVTAASTSLCTPALFTFIPTIVPNVTPSSATYDYGDGNTGTSPTHTYSTAGTYTVTYSYTLSAGCSYSATTTITVGTKPTASFSAAPLTTCPATNITFTNTSVNATSFLWLYGDGLTGTAVNPIHSYEVTGSVTVTLIATGTGGCKDTMVRNNYVTVLLPHAQFSPGFTCINRLTVNFTDQSNGADTWLWHFGDGTTSTASNPSHIYSNYGTDTVILTVHNNATGCDDNYIFPITLSPLVTSVLHATDSNSCKNKAVVFSIGNIPGVSNYSWNFGDGSTLNTAGNTCQHAYTTPGIYTLKLIFTDASGCQDTVTKTNYISVGSPTAAYVASPLTGCLPLNVSFTDQSSSSIVPLVNRQWFFGDGNVTNTASAGAQHTYISNGSYSTMLVVTDANGCKDSLLHVNYVQASRPHASFTSNDTNICIQTNANFVNTSTGNGLSYQWSFGDGINAFATNPFHAYANSGNYNIRLVVTDQFGCMDTMSRLAYIHVGNLFSSFTINDSFATCPPLSVICTNTTSGSNTYTWTFGNGGQSVLSNPSTVYTYPGIYHIKMVAHNAVGCVDSMIRNIAVLGPTGNFSISNAKGCTPLTVSLNVNNSNGATSYTWDMNNGYTHTTTVPNFTYTYTNPGNYIPLVVISNGSCQVPITSDTVVSDLLNANFTFPTTTYCTPAFVQFTDSSWGNISGISVRNWSFGDGTTGTGHNPAHIYTAPGAYQVKLVIGNVYGCKDTLTKTITILQKPTVSISGIQPICPGQTPTVTLTANGANTYFWSPGTGLGCTTCAATTVLPPSTTTYTIVGTATNGCKDTATGTVTINTIPTVSAGANVTTCANHPVQLNASGASTYVWTPATGLSCTGCQSPVAIPGSSVTYTVTGTTTAGCTGTSTVTVNVNAVPISNLDSSKGICIGKSVTLQGFSPGAITYLWYPSTGLSCFNCSNPVASPVTTMHYSLVAYGNNGCNDTAHIVVAVNPLPVVSVPSQSVCAGIPTQITASGAKNYNWYPSSGLSCANCAAPLLNISTNAAYTIVGADSNGCVDTTTASFTVTKRVATNIGNGDSICYGANAQLTADGGIQYTWTPTANLSNPNIANPIATPGNTTTYTVYIKENNCFTDTLQETVVVYPLPVVTAGASQVILDGETAHLTIKSSLDVVKFAWLPPDGLSCADCQSPEATPTHTTTYTITVTGQGGCTDSAQTTIFLKCVNGQVFIPNIFTPNGDGNNDHFYVSGKGISRVKRVSVYNRWGEAVYEAANVPVNDPNQGWDGKYRGALLQPDVFVYLITVECETGELLEYKGDISLIK